jgi:8-oxo-dGTP pyrophosphatase MutT (NUDIX family)
MSVEENSTCPKVKVDRNRSKRLHVINAVFTFVNGLDQQTVLLTRNEEGFLTLPGGKREFGETKRKALARELGEELPNVNFSGGRFKWDYSVIGLTPISKRRVKAEIYLFEGVINIKNKRRKLYGREIKGIKFVILDRADIEKSKVITEVTKEALRILIQKLEDKAKVKEFKISFSLDKISTQG